MTDANQASAIEPMANQPTDEVLEALKRKAETLGVKYGPRIGIDALREKINAAMEGEAEAEEASVNLTKHGREAKLRAEIFEREMRMIRVRITNLNPHKKELRGEIFTVANKYIGDVKKFIPYGEVTDEGYHIPHVLFTELRDRKFLSIRTKMVKGQIEVLQRWVPEFALEVLEPLAPKELAKLANQQAAAAGASAASEE